MPKVRSNAYKIFHYPFQCLIPNEFLFSDKEQESVGVFSTGDAEQDMAWSQQCVPYLTTIAKLAEIFDEGGGFTFVDPQDTVKVYDIIVGHLNDCIEISQYQINGKKPPIEDLKLLDKLAGEIYRSSRVLLATTNVVPDLLSTIESISVFNKNKPKKNKVQQEHHPLTVMMNNNRLSGRIR